MLFLDKHRNFFPLSPKETVLLKYAGTSSFKEYFYFIVTVSKDDFLKIFPNAVEQIESEMDESDDHPSEFNEVPSENVNIKSLINAGHTDKLVVLFYMYFESLF